MKNKFVKAVDRIAQAKVLQPLLKNRWTETASMGVSIVTNPITIWSSGLPTSAKVAATTISVSAISVALLSARCKELAKRAELETNKETSVTNKHTEPPAPPPPQ